MEIKLTIEIDYEEGPEITYCTAFWTKNGLMHRNNGPAVIEIALEQDTRWYYFWVEGKFHGESKSRKY